MRPNTDIRLKSIEICNPEHLSDENLLKVMTLIYKLPPEELLRPEGKTMSDFLRKVNQEISTRCERARKNHIIKVF